MALFASTPVRLQPFFGYRSETQLTITARALRSGRGGGDCPPARGVMRRARFRIGPAMPNLRPGAFRD